LEKPERSAQNTQRVALCLNATHDAVMRQFLSFLLAVSTVSACQAHETLIGFAGAPSAWVLRSMDGVASAVPITLTLDRSGTLGGQAPCNRYSAVLSAPYPWFEVSGLKVTRKACPDLAQEAAYLSALQAMTLSEVSGDMLVLSDTQDRALVFTRDLR
jgi:heat shock protein HslJ